MDGRSTVLSFLRSHTISLLTIPLGLAASACDTGSASVADNGGATTSSGGASTTQGGSGNATSSGGTSSGGTGSGGTSSGGTSNGGILNPVGGAATVPTVECQGAFPMEDVSKAAAKATVADTSWGALPHFWTTFGLGRLGLYLNQSQLPAAEPFHSQDKTNHDGMKWSDALKAQTVDAVKNLELKSIRAHGLFHDDIGIYSENANGDPVYDFTRSDIIFDFLVKENKVAPIIELADMPSALAKDKSQVAFDNGGKGWKMIVSPPKDYAKWQALVQNFVQHSVDRYGKEVVSTWYFEVWNEPECCGGKFWKGSFPDDYLTLWDKSAAGVHAVLPDARVGGPVSSQADKLPDAGVSFLEHIKTSKLPLGFFSYHTWAFIDGAVNGYFQGLDLLDKYQQNSVQIAVTEFGPTWEFGLLGGSGEPAWEPQETIQGAAFVAQVYSNIAQKCAKDKRRFPIAYAWWTLSDVFDEGYEDAGDYAAEKNPFIGAMGLVSRENIKKPAYNAYKFLAGMGDEQLSLTVSGGGNVGGMASRSTKNGGVQVILYNGQNPGAGYQDDTYYQVSQAQDFGVTVAGMNPKMAYDVTAYRVDDAHGNSFATWDSGMKKSMDSMSAGDWQTLRTAMDSPPESVAKAVCGSAFSKTFSLSSPGVFLLTFEPAVAK
jgi:xylan 1,4-beta-xylosidase